jgi:hypothetical protein
VTRTRVPTGPPPGVKVSIIGLTVKLLALVAVPPGVVTLIGPFVAPRGTLASILVDLTAMSKSATAVPLNFTVTPFGLRVNPVP